MIGLRNGLERLIVRGYSRMARRSFRDCGSVYIHPLARIDNARYITLKSGVSVGRHAWLYAITSDSAGRTYQPDLYIDEGAKIGAFCHITCAERLYIGKNVLMAHNVLITDSKHTYENPDAPIISQGITKRPTAVGDDCWLGNNAVILGCCVGKHCVIGANAVVTHDVPDYCVVAGAPARIVKRYDFDLAVWRNVSVDPIT